MGLLQKAAIETGYLKAGFLGFAGAGKTHTAFLVAMGLLEATGDKRPIAMVDTEAGSDWWVERLKSDGYDLMVAKTRSFADLLQVGQEAEGECSILIVDSISHIWKELLEAYQRKFKVSRLAFHHWNVIKPEWARFTDWFLNSPIHVIICGRAGYEYDYDEDDQGNKELIKTGTKMKAEGEFGFEPSLLVEMMKIKHSVVTRDPDAKGWVHRAVVLKDRSDRMNGAELDQPTYQSFLPHMSAINIGGAHRVIDADRKSDDMFDDRDYSAINRKRNVDIALENIQDVFVLADIGSRSDKDKKEMKLALIDAFETAAWSAIKNMPLEALEEGLVALKKRYGQYEEPKDHLDDPLPWEEGDEKAHGPVGVGMDANVVQPPPEGKPLAEVFASEDEGTGELFEQEKMGEAPEAGSNKAEYAKLYKMAWEEHDPDASQEKRLDWQQGVIGKRNRGQWGVVDYIRAIAELGGKQ